MGRSVSFRDLLWPCLRLRGSLFVSDFSAVMGLEKCVIVSNLDLSV